MGILIMNADTDATLQSDYQKFFEKVKAEGERTRGDVRILVIFGANLDPGSTNTKIIKEYGQMMIPYVSKSVVMGITRVRASLLAGIRLTSGRLIYDYTKEGKDAAIAKLKEPFTKEEREKIEKCRDKYARRNKT